MATTAGRRSASISTAMWLDTLRVPLARGLLSGEEERGQKNKKMSLTSGTHILSLGFRCIDETADRLEVTSSSSSAGGLLLRFRAVKSSIDRTALLCSSAVHCSLVCEGPGSCYRRAIFVGHDLAVQGSTRSSPSHRQGALVALVRQRRQPHALGSIGQHQYSAYACGSEHILFRPCLST